MVCRYFICNICGATQLRYRRVLTYESHLIQILSFYLITLLLYWNRNNYILLYSTLLYSTAPFCIDSILLYCIPLYCTVPHSTLLHCTCRPRAPDWSKTILCHMRVQPSLSAAVLKRWLLSTHSVIWEWPEMTLISDLIKIRQREMRYELLNVTSSNIWLACTEG